MKKSLALLLALVMTLALVACGGGNNKAPANNAPANNAPADNTPADPAPAEPSGDKIDISVIAAQYGQNTAKWWADFQDEFNKTYEKDRKSVV